MPDSVRRSHTHASADLRLRHIATSECVFMEYNSGFNANTVLNRNNTSSPASTIWRHRPTF
jgi:hypothetical protein